MGFSNLRLNVHENRLVMEKVVKILDTFFEHNKILYEWELALLHSLLISNSYKNVYI